MALLFAHPVSGFADAPDAEKAGFDVGDGVNQVGYETTGGRYGDGCFVGTSGGASKTLLLPVNGASGKILVQFLIKFSGAISNNVSFLRLHNNSGAAECMALRLDGAGKTRVLDASSLPVGSDSAALSLDRWYCIAVEAEVGSSSGTVKVWIDGALVHNLSSIDLDDGSGDACDQVRFFATTSSAPTWRVCQLIVYDTSGAAPWNSFIGEKRIFVLLPETDDAVQWTRNTGSTNAAAVDDAVSAGSDSDTTYVSATSDKFDSYDYTDLPFTGMTGIIGVVGVIEAKNADAGGTSPLSFELDAGLGAGNVALPAPGTSYGELQALYPNVPGGSGWTSAQVNALQGGPKVVAA